MFHLLAAGRSPRLSILADKFNQFYPEGRLFRRCFSMRTIASSASIQILPSDQILVLSLWGRLGDEAAMTAQQMLSQRVQHVVGRADRTVSVLFSGCRFDFTVLLGREQILERRCCR
jgi:hypothetical protein